MPCLGSTQHQLQCDAADLRLLRATVPERAVRAHEHEEAHLVLVLHGTYLSSASGMPEASHAPVLVCNPPGTQHRDRFADTDGLFLTIAMTPQAWLQRAPSVRARKRARRMEIPALVDGLRLARLLRSHDAADRLDAEAYLDALLRSATEVHLQADTARPRWLARAREALRCIDASLSLGAVARDCGVHAAQLSRAFRRFEGCTPGQYVRRQRLQVATERLARDEVGSIAEAAQDAGFFDHAHLVRALKQETGVTPTQLRHLLRDAAAVDAR